ncbi:MAG: 3'-5' exoribonuclease YhaM family protein [Planctomycetota bacterium]|jgi:3'-5' exoribonuclease
MAKRTSIINLTANEFVEGVYTIQNCQLGLTKNGKHFIKCLLVDSTGRAPGRMWNATQELFNTLPTNGFVEIEGQTQPYQGEMQIIIQKIRPIEPTTEQLIDLLPSTARDIDTMFAQVTKILESLEHPAIQALVKQYLGDKDLMDRFKQAPAAMQLHHAYLGGLLEHTLSLMNLADKILFNYPEINRDIVIFGLFIHDLGKCVELSWMTGFGYTDEGHLVGHIARGAIWVEEKSKAARDAGAEIPQELIHVLQHIVLSHHGQPEFGALKIPATPEAIMVSLLDNLDAKMQMAIAAGRGPVNEAVSAQGNFTEKVWALDTRIYRPDPLAAPKLTEENREPLGSELSSELQAAIKLGGLNTEGKGGL